MPTLDSNDPARRSRSVRLMALERDVLRFLRGALGVAEGAAGVVAVSGGGDSMALLRILDRLSRSGRFALRLSVAHLDHGLRAESADEAAFVRDCAQALGLPFYTQRVDVRRRAKQRREGIEEAARAARYGFLTQTALDAGAVFVATGHTAGDQAETVLMRLVRGAGPQGLAGIPPRRALCDAPRIGLIRPLLEQSRPRLQAYLKRLGQPWRSDPTNRDTNLLRARVRHELLPLLASNYNPAIGEALTRTAAIMRQLADWTGAEIDRAAQALDTGSDTVLISNAAALAALPPPLACGALRRLLTDRGMAADRLGADMLGRLYEMASDGRATPAVTLPGGLRVCRRGDTLLLDRPGSEVPPADWPARVVGVPGRTVSKPGGFELTFRVVSADGFDMAAFRQAKPPNVEAFDADRLGGHVRVRPRRDGDRWHPLGSPGRRKVKESLIDGRVPRADRRRIIVVENAQDRIVWLAPLRIAEDAKVTPRTRRLCLAALRLT